MTTRRTLLLDHRTFSIEITGDDEERTGLDARAVSRTASGLLHRLAADPNSTAAGNPWWFRAISEARRPMRPNENERVIRLPDGRHLTIAATEPA